MVLASYEAEQHLLHFGCSETPVCWTICGLMSEPPRKFRRLFYVSQATMA